MNDFFIQFNNFSLLHLSNHLQGLRFISNLIKRIVDISCDDFAHVAKILGNCDQEKLKSNVLAHLLDETKDFWRYRIKSTACLSVWPRIDPIRWAGRTVMRWRGTSLTRYARLTSRTVPTYWRGAAPT